MKICTRCKTSKPFSDFSIAKTKDWYHCYCIDCNREHQKEWKEKNKEKVKAYMVWYQKWYYQKRKEKIDEKNKKWAKNNPEKMKEYFDRYIEKPWVREKRNLKTSEWWKNNPENNRQRCNRRRNLINSTSDWTIDKSSLQYVLYMQEFRCNICWCDIRWNAEKDHIIPLSRWWKHTIWNIQYLCWLCNRKKWTSIL